LPPQWQPPQYPYPQPQYTPPPMAQPPPPKKKSHKKRWFLIGGIIVLMLIIGGIASAMGGGSKSPTRTPAPTTPSTQAIQPTAKPTQVAATPVIGKPWKVNDTWTVTVNAVYTSQGDQYTAPAAGQTYLVVDVTLVNTSNQTQHASGLVQWALKDPSGQTYNDTLLIGTDPGGTVAAGGKIRGQIAYKVPLAIHTYTLQFTPDFGNDVAEWTVKI
jgi:hypothetical protein